MEKITLQNCQIDAVSTDSREAARLAAEGRHVLFVPIVGERVDAHRFLESVAQSGVTAAFAAESWLAGEAGQALSTMLTTARETDPDSPAGRFHLIPVKNTRDAMQQLAAEYRSQFQIPLIGITGSVGKTTTKEMVAAALESALTIHKTAGNQNSQIGLPLTIFGLENHHEAAVIEMGMSEFHEMARIAAVARPDHAIMTNIGVAHIGNLGSQENIRAEKLHITDHFHAGSTLLLNADDPLLAETAVQMRADQTCDQEITIWTYGIAEDADFRATDIRVCSKDGFIGQEFLFHYPDGEPELIRLQVLGMHNVRNALTALAMAWKLGISPKTAATGLAAYAPLAMRGTLIEHNDIRILDDSYNASPDSMKASVEVLSSLPDVAHRIVVFADVLELGERSEDLHREVGTFLAAHNEKNAPIHTLVTIGPESRHIQAGYLEVAGASPAMTCCHFETNAEATAYLKSCLTAGDAILIKGSRGMRTDEIVTSLQQ